MSVKECVLQTWTFERHGARAGAREAASQLRRLRDSGAGGGEKLVEADGRQAASRNQGGMMYGEGYGDGVLARSLARYAEGIRDDVDDGRDVDPEDCIALMEGAFVMWRRLMERYEEVR